MIRSRLMLSLTKCSEVKIIAIPEGPQPKNGCCCKRIWTNGEIDYLYIRENSVEIYSPVNNARCCSCNPMNTSAEVLYYDSEWKVRNIGDVCWLRRCLFGSDGEKVVFEFCPWWCCCERKREVGVLDGAATVRVIERVRGLAARRLSMERK
ncbi:hypothetical protein TrST_g9232 [Triparma strigata]|uniref:Phospholipid scramblase n=2 Tax=Triparma TaxID=722752 RepID=A0A9W7BFI0_9STRA|nr:hypothetical protein TrST_g9232 [Triparma strigata]